MMILPFHGLQFVLELHGQAFQEKKALREKIVENGGTISYILTRKTDFIVASKQCDNYKTRKAYQLGIPVVTEDFIHVCNKSKKLLDVFEFLAKDDRDLEKFKKGCIVSPKFDQIKSKPVAMKIVNVKAINWVAFSTDIAKQIYVMYKFAILSLTHNTGKLFCVLEIHVLRDTESKCFRVLKSFYEDKKAFSILQSQVFCTENSLEVAEEIYCAVYEDEIKKSQFHKRLYHIQRGHCLGSSQLQSWQEEMKCNYGNLHPEVSQFVGMLWREAMDNIAALGKKWKATHVDFSFETILNALAVLYNMRLNLDNEKEFDKLKQNYFTYIPHESTDFPRTKRAISHEEEYCMLLKEFIVEKEVKVANAYDPLNLYYAMKCSIQYLSPSEHEYQYLQSKLEKVPGLKLCRIFKLYKHTEELQFNVALSNLKQLYHSSKQENLVSIVTNGLQLPGETTGKFGITRTDPGKLGSGLYFTDSVEATVKYSNLNEYTGTRIMLVNDVLLGDCYEVTTSNESLNAPPDGFNSVCGKESEKGDFKYNEFCIYDKSQQKLKYIVEYTLSDDKKIKTDHPCPTISTTKFEKENVDKKDTLNLGEFENPLKCAKLGLVVSSEHENPPVSLKEVHVRGKIIDCSSEIVLFQVYNNNTDEILEAKYVFPMSDNAAVCGFEAYINNKHVVGKVKEKEKAHKEYKKAVKQGHGAYLMDQESTDIFTVSIGNIPPHSKVVLKITYVSESTIKGESILFSLPGHIADWSESMPVQGYVTQTSTRITTAKSDAIKSSLELSIDMPFDIRAIESLNHKIITKQTKTKAVVRLSKSTNLDGNDFILKLSVAEIHVPRMWVEKNETDQANMVTFYPEFEYDPIKGYEAIILLDMSNSMAVCTREAKAITNFLIKNLPSDCIFNVLCTGSHYEEAFVISKPATQENKDLAWNFVQECQPEMGGSDISHVLNSLTLKSNQFLNVFLVSDGYVDSKDSCLLAASNLKNGRVFSMGIGGNINQHFLQLLAIKSGGFYEKFDMKRKFNWIEKVVKQCNKASQPALVNPHIKWITHNENNVLSENEPLESPVVITSIFKGSRVVAYSFLNDCSQAELRAKIGERDFSLIVSAPSLNGLKGETLHKLTAKSIIHDHECQVLDVDVGSHFALKQLQKKSIISMSIKHSIVSQYTSFVAVEERAKEEVSSLIGPSIEEIMQATLVDILPDLQWDLSNEEPDVSDKVVKLLKEISLTETYSIVQSKYLAKQVDTFLKVLPADDPLRIIIHSLHNEEYEFINRPVTTMVILVLSSVLIKHRNINYPNLKAIVENKHDLDYSSAITTLCKTAFPDSTYNFIQGTPMQLRSVLSAFITHLVQDRGYNVLQNSGIDTFLCEMYDVMVNYFERFDSIDENFKELHDKYNDAKIKAFGVKRCTEKSSQFSELEYGGLQKNTSNLKKKPVRLLRRDRLAERYPDPEEIMMHNEEDYDSTASTKTSNKCFSRPIDMQRNMLSNSKRDLLVKQAVTGLQKMNQPMQLEDLLVKQAVTGLQKMKQPMKQTTEYLYQEEPPNVPYPPIPGAAMSATFPHATCESAPPPPPIPPRIKIKEHLLRSHSAHSSRSNTKQMPPRSGREEIKTRMFSNPGISIDPTSMYGQQITEQVFCSNTKATDFDADLYILQNQESTSDLELDEIGSDFSDDDGLSDFSPNLSNSSEEKNSDIDKQTLFSTFHPAIPIGIFQTKLNEKETLFYQNANSKCPILFDKIQLETRMKSETPLQNMTFVFKNSSEKELSEKLDLMVTSIEKLGLRSLPLQIQSLAKTMLRISMLLVLYRICLSQNFPKLKQCEHVILKDAFNKLQHLDSQYPMLYHTLELGRDWFESGLNIMIQNV